jgi:hypothetical protein
MFTCCEHPMAGKRQLRTLLAMQLAMAGSSPDAFALSTLPFGPTETSTLTFAEAFCDPPRSQQVRRMPDW